MNARIRQTTIARTPHAFVSKRGEPVLVTPLDDDHEAGLVQMYLEYRPRNAFWGLPPLQDEACRLWARGMVANGLNLVALAYRAGVVGHAALFPMDGDVCELLVVVAPAFQNVGIGTQLARCAVQLAHEVGFSRIWISVEANNFRARHVFRKCGFEYLRQDDPAEVEMALDVRGYQDPSAVRAADVMTRQVLSAHPDMTCAAAIETFLREPIGAMPVLADSGEVVGIVSQTDLILPRAAAKRVADVMTRPVVTVPEDCPLARVISLLHSRRIRCVPVVDAQNRLVGVIGRKDLLVYFATHG